MTLYLKFNGPEFSPIEQGLQRLLNFGFNNFGQEYGTCQLSLTGGDSSVMCHRTEHQVFSGQLLHHRRTNLLLDSDDRWAISAVSRP